MSYQEYAQLGKSRTPTPKNGSRSRSRSASASRGGSSAEERQRSYMASISSFSGPRKSQPASHVTTPSTSTISLSPSNSASQKGLRRSSKSNNWGGGGSNPMTLKHLKEMENGEGKLDVIDVPLRWRPFFLQRKILVAFFAIFVAAIITLEALLDYSSKNAGLGTSRAAQYLWRYAPTALLTVVTIMWNRVEFQAKNAAPWVRMSKGGADVDKTLLLDYVSMFQPVAIVAALKNNDYVVACATAVSLLLRISIIVSTGLVSLVFFTGIDENAPIVMTSEFVNDLQTMPSVGSLAVLTMLNMQQGNLFFPDGVSSRFAFQQFTSDYPATTQFNARVDGFAGGLDCEPASLTFSGVSNSAQGLRFETGVTVTDCSLSIPVLSQSFSGAGAENRTHFFARLGQAGCGNSTNVDAQRIAILFGTGSIDPRANLNPIGANAVVNGSITQSQQLICKPTYAISKVDVVKNSTTLVSVDLALPPQVRALDNVQPWDVAQAFFDSFANEVAAGISDSKSAAFPTQDVNADAPMNLAFSLATTENGTAGTAQTYFDAGALESLASNYFAQYTAILAQKNLMQPSATPQRCLAVLNADRLVIRTVAVQILAVGVALMILLCMVMICLVPSRGFLPRDPNTIMDLATLLAHSKPLLQSLRGAGGADIATIRQRLQGSLFSTGVEAYPRGSSATDQGYFRVFGGSEMKSEYVEQASHWPYSFGLHPAQRSIVLMLVVGVIGVLEATLRLSANNAGLATVGDDEALMHFVWTSLPALIVAFLTLFFMATNFSTRALAPFAELIGTGGSFKTMTMNYLDRAAPAVIMESIRSRNFAVLSTAIAAFLGALLPIFMATLMSTLTIPATASVQLQSLDIFANASTVAVRNGTLISSLVLETNLSYPRFTFEDLAFPSVTLPSIPVNLAANDDLVVTATLPATRPSMACRFFSQPDLGINITVNSRVGDILNPLRIDIPGEVRRGTSELLASTFIIGTAAGPNATADSTPLDSNAFFGQGDFRPVVRNGQTVSHWVYVWGQLSGANTNQVAVRTISALTCDESYQQLSVLTTFNGKSLQIEPSIPPQPIESTIAPSDAPVTPFDYTGLVNISTPHLLDGFFSSLISSRYAIAATDLGIADARIAERTVTQAIIRQHKIIRTQVLSSSSRRPISPPTIPTTPFPATASSLRAGTRRVVQDPATTRVLQALLITALLASLAAWALRPKPNLLPRPPTSIAAAAALLADGNVFAFFGRGAEWQPLDEVRTRFRDGLHVTAGFALGWHRVRRGRRDGLHQVDSARGGMEGVLGNGSAGAGGGGVEREEVFGISALRTGGWGGGENVGLGLQARVGMAQRGFVRDLGWRG